MGKRFSLGIFLLGFLLLVSFLVNYVTAGIFHPAQKMLEQAAQYALEQDWDSAVHLSKTAQNRWYRYRRFTATVADQNPMDDTDRLFAELEVFGFCRDSEHFAATCMELSVMCQAMGDAHSGSWWNLL